jgi:hypothetical protein
MNKNTQDRILAEIERRVAAIDETLTVINDRALANTGVLGVVRPDELVAQHRMSYQFNDGMATFQRRSTGGKDVSRTDRGAVYVDYAKGPGNASDKIGQVVSFLVGLA